MINKLYCVIPKILYRGSAPSPIDVLKLKLYLNIRKIVSLDKESGDKIENTCQKLNINHIKMYINSDKKSLYHFLSQDLNKLFLQGGPTFTHCLRGQDRTGLAIALIKCQYMGVSPEKAIEEAKSLGFGIGLDPKITRLYENIIKSCKPKSQDVNNATIVSNERQTVGDNRDSYLDEGRQGSFAPFLSQTREYPYDYVYNPINDQSMTRENYWMEKIDHKYNKKDIVPMVGVFNNDAGIHSLGPTENMTGFFYD